MNDLNWEGYEDYTQEEKREFLYHNDRKAPMTPSQLQIMGDDDLMDLEDRNDRAFFRARSGEDWERILSRQNDIINDEVKKRQLT